MSFTKHEIERSDGSYEMTEHRSSPWSIIMGAGAAGTMMLMALSYTGVFDGGGKPTVLGDEGSSIELSSNNIRDDIVFNSDWSTGVGTSLSAILDSAKTIPWDQYAAGDAQARVIVVTDSMASTEFPTTNVLAVISQTTQQTVRLTDTDVIPIPTIGSSLFYRWYFRAARADSITIDPDNHPIQDATTGVFTNWQFETVMDTNGTYDASWQMDNAGQGRPFPDNAYYVRDLYKDSTYRFELQIRRTTVDSFTVHSRVAIRREGVDVPLFTDGDFDNKNDTGTLLDSLNLGFYDTLNLRLLQVGLNGVGGDFGTPSIVSYQGGVAVCTETWCGEYNPSVEN